MYLVNNDANHDPHAFGYENNTGSDAELVIPALEQLMLRHLSEGAHILDIGCLDGEIVKHLNIRANQW